MDAGRPRFQADRREREKLLAAQFFGVLWKATSTGLRESAPAHVRAGRGRLCTAAASARSIIGAEKVNRTLAGNLLWLAGIDVTSKRLRRYSRVGRDLPRSAHPEGCRRP